MDKKRPVADDSPAFLAPALDLRRVVALVEAGSPADLEQATALALSFPIPSRPWRDPPAAAPSSSSADADARETFAASPYKNAGDTTVQQSSRDILVRSLFSIGPLPHVADAVSERPTADRVLVGRARAIRFRIALEDAWAEAGEPRGKRSAAASGAGGDEPALALMLDVAALMMIADGMPSEECVPSPNDLPMVRTVLDEVRRRWPAVSRRAFKEAAVTAFARSTLLGFSRALQYVKSAAAPLSTDEREACLALATRLSSIPTLNDHRALALGGLRRAVSA
jgi:hypothetical protein